MNDNSLGLPKDNSGIEMSPEEHAAKLAVSMGVNPQAVVDATTDTLDISGDDPFPDPLTSASDQGSDDTLLNNIAEYGDEYAGLPDMDIEEAEEEEEEDIDEEEEIIYELGHRLPLKTSFRYRRGSSVHEITELVFKHVLTAGKVENLAVMMDGKMTWGDTMKIIALCTGHHPKVIKKLSTPDLIEASGIAMSFFANGHQR